MSIYWRVHVFFDGFAPENVKKTTPITHGFRGKEAYFQLRATFEKGEHQIFGETHVNRTSCFCLKNEWYTSKFNQGGIDPAKLGTGNSKSVRCWKIRLLMIIRWFLSVNMLHNVTTTHGFFLLIRKMQLIHMSHMLQQTISINSSFS